MSYFSAFPYTTFTVGNKESIVKDVFRRAAFLSEYKPYTDLYLTHTIIDGETPQSIAKEFYGATTYHWVVLMFNEIHNPLFDWPISYSAVESLCRASYGDDMYSVRHYERDGVIVGEYKEYNSDFPWVPPAHPNPEAIDIFPVIFLEHEEKLNDAKRSIQLLRPELLGDFVKQFGVSING